MYLSNISNDILEFIFKFLSTRDKLNLIKIDKRLIHNLRIDGIKIQFDFGNSSITDDDLFYLNGIHKINLTCCSQITDKGLRYLADKSMFLSCELEGVHTVSLSNYDQGLKYLTGVHTINLSGCNQITDQGLQYLKGVHNINLKDCNQITDQGLQYLKGVHTINLKGCNQITDQGLQYLKGVHTINLKGCNQITNQGLKYLTGVHTINLDSCEQITVKCLQYIEGVHTVCLDFSQLQDEGSEYLFIIPKLILSGITEIIDQ